MKIDKDVPIPTKESGQDKKKISRHIFHDMEIGDSILIDGANQYSPVVCAFRVLSKRHGKKITTRTVNGGIRIWRTS